LALVALVVIVPVAIAMVPGPTEEDDVPPLPEPDAIFTPEYDVKLPETVKLADYATYPKKVYARCKSIGFPNRGALRGGVLFPRNTKYYVAARPDRQWATPETVDGLLFAATKVHDRFGSSHRLAMGDISYPQGGRLSTHRSHQAGRDADIGFYFKNAAPGHLVDGSSKNLDVPRNWLYLESLIDLNTVKFVFLDYQIQALLYNYVKNRLHYPQAYLDRVFQYPKGRRERQGIIRHSRGHLNHYHIRFYSPIAVANARNADFKEPRLAQLQSQMNDAGTASTAAAAMSSAITAKRARRAYYGTAGQPTAYRVRKGDTLWSIARKYGVTVSQVRAWNDLSSTARLRVGQTLTLYRPTHKKPAATAKSR